MAILEVCCGSLESVITAQRAGAHRIELCSALDEGGVTPSYGLMHSVGRLDKIKKHVLIRPRGGDFHYDIEELQIMLADIRMAHAEGFDGVVVGALTTDGEVDLPACRALVAAAEGMSVTFHRAFDLCANRTQALEQIIELGFDRVLTSGGAPTAYEGRVELQRLVQLAAGRIVIMPGAGVKSTNAGLILETTGAQEIHASARAPRPSDMRFKHRGVSMGVSEHDEYLRYETSPASVMAILAAIG